MDPSGVDWPWVQMEGGGSHPTHATQSKIPNASRAVGRAYTRVGQHAHLSFIPFPPLPNSESGVVGGAGGERMGELGGNRGYFSDVQGSIMQIGIGVPIFLARRCT